MSIRCPECKKEYSSELFKESSEIFCDCGQILGIGQEEVFEHLQQICNQYELNLEEVKLEHIRRSSDRIVTLILNSNCEKSDIDREKMMLKQLIEAISPESIHLYELIYEPRFQRLWDQFRVESPE